MSSAHRFRFEHHVVRLARVIPAAVVNDANEVLLMWRYRFVVNEWGWALPGGIAERDVDQPGLEPSACRARLGFSGQKPDAPGSG